MNFLKSKPVKQMTWIDKIIDAIERKNTCEESLKYDAQARDFISQAESFYRQGNKEEAEKFRRMAEEAKQNSDMAASFDLELDDGQFPTIHWLIAKFMHEGDPEYMIVKEIQNSQGMIQRNIDDAIAKMLERGTPVFKIMETSRTKPGQPGRNIRCITLRPNYKDAKLATIERRQMLTERAICNGFDWLTKVSPELLDDFKKSVDSKVCESHENGKKNGQLGQGSSHAALPVGNDMTQVHIAGNM